MKTKATLNETCINCNKKSILVLCDACVKLREKRMKTIKTKSKAKRITLIGWTLKKHIFKSTFGWAYLDYGENNIAICCRKGFEKSINTKLFKKVRITVTEAK